MKKRIGVLMYQTSNSKGQELVAQRMVRDFASLGHEAYLITSVYHDGLEVIPPESLRKGNGYVLVQDSELEIPVIRVDSYVVKWPQRRIGFHDFVHVLERIVDEFKLNVLITHSTLWNGPEEVAKFVAWRRYMKDLGGYEDPLVLCHMSHFQEPTKRRYSLVERTFRMAWNKFSLSQILKMANFILVVTPFEKKSKVKMGADPKKCLLFPSGVNEELFLRYATSDVKKFLQNRRLPENVKLVSYLGSLEERKNPLAVLKVAQLLKERRDIHFVIAGRGDSRYAERLRKEARRTSNVTYLGEVEDREKILLIKSSYVNILLSQLEALGLAQLEFMYFGVPVVTSAVGGQSWLVQNGKEGLHTHGPEDVQGAAKAIVDLVDNSELWNRLSSNAREKARDFVSSKMIRELDDAITEEMIKETGLRKIPVEARETLSEPETVLKTWSAGSWGVVATERRLFVRHGRISRKVAEIPYGNISFIEHTRRYPWNILLPGFLPALVLSLQSLWWPIVHDFLQRILQMDEAVFSMAEQNFAQALYSPVTSVIPQLNWAQLLAVIFVIVPMASSLAVFGFEARTGFNLYGSGMKPVYLPHRFSEVVTFIRKVQDRQPDAVRIESRDIKQQP